MVWPHSEQGVAEAAEEAEAAEAAAEDQEREREGVTNCCLTNNTREEGERDKERGGGRERVVALTSFH
jgi:hypothetical protein